ncbi:unnamed protein product [Rhizophagus irregularis]|nr:unnamed protein product [Rhizophagus irregularis]
MGTRSKPEFSDPTRLSKDYFSVIKDTTLQHCIPFIRFYNLTFKRNFRFACQSLNQKPRKLNNVDSNKLTSSYKFKLILRGSRDGFFTCVENHILSRVKNEQYAIFNVRNCGPLFGNQGGDLTIWGDNFYERSYCRKRSYKKRIRKTEDTFSVEEYEVFQIIREMDG